MTKLSKQQEAFALNIIEGMNAGDAYRAAGYKCATDEAVWAAASRLLGNVKVTEYIEAHRQKAAQEAQIDLQWLINESVDLYQQAKKDGSHAAANATLKTIGVYTGLWNEKSTRENINRNADDLTDAELAAYLKADGGEDTAEAASGTRTLN